MKGIVRIIVTLACLAVVTAATVLLVLRPLNARVEEDREAIEQRRTQLVKLERVARRISDLQKEIHRLEDALAFFEDRLPEEKEIDVILREVWLIAEQKALVARSVRTQTAASQPRYNLQPITISLQGTFESFYEFMLGLERLPRITKIRQMQVAKSPLQEGSVDVDLVMDIFFEKKS